MSYILDALRRADAEREGASVHGGFGQAHADEADDADLPAPASPWVWMAAGMLLVVLAGLFWRWVVMDAPPPTVPVVAVPATQPSVPSVPVPQAPPVAVAPPAVIAQETPPVMAAPVAPVLPPESHPTLRKPVAASPAAPRLAERATAPAAAAPERAPAPEARVYQLSELPDDIRRQLPQLTVGGAMYSDKPASRMVILNGQLFHEGDALTPTVSLRQIKLKSAVLEFKGFRYELNY